MPSTYKTPRDYGFGGRTSSAYFWLGRDGALQKYAGGLFGPIVESGWLSGLTVNPPSGSNLTIRDVSKYSVYSPLRFTPTPGNIFVGWLGLRPVAFSLLTAEGPPPPEEPLAFGFDEESLIVQHRQHAYDLNDSNDWMPAVITEEPLFLWWNPVDMLSLPPGVSNQAESPSYTAGMQFTLNKPGLGPIDITGVRFAWAGAATTIKVTLWSTTASLATKSLAIPGAGIHEILFDTPFTVTDAFYYRILRVSVWNTASDSRTVCTDIDITTHTSSWIGGPMLFWMGRVFGIATGDTNPSDLYPDTANVIEPIIASQTSPTNPSPLITWSAVDMLQLRTPAIQGPGLTTGQEFLLFKPGKGDFQITGVRFYWAGGASTIKVALWDIPGGGTPIATKTLAVPGVGVHTILFDSPYVVAADKYYTPLFVSVFNTSAATRTVSVLIVGDDTLEPSWFPAADVGLASSFWAGPGYQILKMDVVNASGDGPPFTPNLFPDERFPVEPVLELV